MTLPPRTVLMATSALSLLAMLYVGAYQVRIVEHLRCPLFKHSCEAVADAPFARPFGFPDGFLAAGMYGVLLVLVLINPQATWYHYAIRAIAIFAAIGNAIGVVDMTRLGGLCVYCLFTAALAQVLVWMTFLL